MQWSKLSPCMETLLPVSRWELFPAESWSQNISSILHFESIFGIDWVWCFKLLNSQLLDEMAAKRHAVTIDTYTHLLMACVGDKRMGFVLAVRVMRLILWNRMKPSVVCYDNLLRAAKECGCGDNTEVLNKYDPLPLKHHAKRSLRQY